MIKRDIVVVFFLIKFQLIRINQESTVRRVAIWKSCEFFFFLLKQGRLVIRNISGNGPTFFFSFYHEV
jgi:hypothetical protein